jgi:hypothetical protein
MGSCFSDAIRGEKRVAKRGHVRRDATTTTYFCAGKGPGVQIGSRSGAVKFIAINIQQQLFLLILALPRLHEHLKLIVASLHSSL